MKNKIIMMHATKQWYVVQYSKLKSESSGISYFELLSLPANPMQVYNLRIVMQ